MTQYFDDIYINDKYSLLGSVKYNPIVQSNVDKITDYYFDEKTIEKAEAKYQVTTIKGLMNKLKLVSEDISLLINSDLQNQILASSLACTKFKIPHLGIYSACASFTQSIIIASNFIKKESDKIISTVSSHNLVSEKQFRFPVEYGAVRKMVNTCTTTGSISVLISKCKSNIKFESFTIGNVTQTNHKDANDMGSAMAPSCAEVIYKHLKDTNRKSEYYDLILTGDLGVYGCEIMKEYYQKKANDKLNNVIDSGSIFYKDENIYAGASGPLCLPIVLFDYILPLKKYKKILIVSTGSLHTVISSNQKIPMPSVSHAVSLEVEY